MPSWLKSVRPVISRLARAIRLPWRALSASGAALLASLLCDGSASACTVPVFRYALERWEPASYELVIFHRGQLSASEQGWLSFASTNQPESSKVNLTVRRADLDGTPPAELLEVWRQQKDLPLPAMVLRPPRGSTPDGVVWSGPFTEAAVRQVVDSPLRQRVAERLLTGASAVWILLESGDKPQDEAAALLLTARLEGLQKTLKLPQIAPDDVVKHRITPPPEGLKIAFPLVRLARGDQAEQVLVRMLLASEDDLEETREPMAFPVFGRGRTLFGLVGKGINDQTVEEACSFVIGPCSCIVKDLNPGRDLVFSADFSSVASPADDGSEPQVGSELHAGERVPIAAGIPPFTPHASATNNPANHGMFGWLGDVRPSNAAALVVSALALILVAGAIWKRASH